MLSHFYIQPLGIIEREYLVLQFYWTLFETQWNFPIAGLQCEAEIDECLSNPCDSEGTEACIDLDNRFQCRCREGFTGEFCETNINDCASLPCLNGGSCRDEVGLFSCDCPPGWTGRRCESDIGTCVTQPCQNSAKCINLFQDFFCV